MCDVVLRTCATKLLHMDMATAIDLPTARHMLGLQNFVHT